jgi:hypothetical protein
MRGHMTEKVDVFAFGVVALETVAGESNHHTTLDEETTYIFEKVRSLKARTVLWSVYYCLNFWLYLEHVHS